jgi:hypothetical protein
MLEGLVYTGDTGEVPSAQAVSAVAGPFPRGCLTGVSSAACLFACEQYGRQDVIHLFEAGIPHVTLVDLDDGRMAHMKRMYRPDWRYEVQDFREFLGSAVAAKAQYDLVTTDPRLVMADEVVGERLRQLAAIARNGLCLLYTADLLERDGYNSGGVERMSQVISARAGRKLEVLEVMHRANTVFWAVIRVADAGTN